MSSLKRETFHHLGYEKTISVGGMLQIDSLSVFVFLYKLVNTLKTFETAAKVDDFFCK